MIELKFHSPGFEELAFKQEEPKESLEELLQRYKEVCNAYKKVVEAKKKAEAPWRRTRINEQGKEETYIDYDAWEKADPKGLWDNALGEFNGFSGIDMLEDRIDVKICYLNQRESK
jgi:hypothetical protein